MQSIHAFDSNGEDWSNLKSNGTIIYKFGHLKYFGNCPKMETVCFSNAVKCVKDADGMAKCET